MQQPPTISLEPLQRRHLQVVRRQRARHALQRSALDAETLDLASAREYAQQLAERRAELQAAGPSPAAAAELGELEPELAALEDALRVQSAVAAHHGARSLALLDKQRRERGALQRVLYHELATTTSSGSRGGAKQGGGEGEGDAGDGDAGGDGGRARSRKRRADDGGGAGGAPSAGAPGEGGTGVSVAVQLGYQPCHGCGLQYRRADGMACSECHRELCGRGGKSSADPLGGPCVGVYQCASCRTAAQWVCHDCLTGYLGRANAYWHTCVGLTDECAAGGPALVCPREPCAAAMECRRCGMAPMCKACAKAHDAECEEEE